MRIWHKDLIPKLCRQHLLAQWREGLGCFKILLYNKPGYRNHPQVRMYRNDIHTLAKILLMTKHEMLRRGYRPRDIFTNDEIKKKYRTRCRDQSDKQKIHEWQTLEQQIEILRNKGCECDV